MLLRYQILEKLILYCPNKLYSVFDCTALLEVFPNISLDMIISSICALQQEGLVNFNYQNGSQFFVFSVSPASRSFLHTVQEIKCLKQREIWENRLYGFIAGIVTAIVSNLILKLLVG